ncbi:MAG: DUF2520 domain-containing protein [Succinivibrio sp.]|nr:DUF2520 domain-containing protein [Succinivibrio sp.]
MQKIGFIGAGKVGISLGRFFKENGFSVSGYYSRSESSSVEGAKFTDSDYFMSVKELVENSDIVFITTPDNALEKTASSIATQCTSIKSEKCFVHCSGALSINDVFKSLMKNDNFSFASVHPMMAFSSREQSYKELKDTFFTLESDEKAKSLILGVFEKLSVRFEIISSDVKSKYHLASVLSSNCVVGLFDYAKELLKECSFSEESANAALGKLFLVNAQNIVEKGTIKALTGPVLRGDDKTVLKHLNVLSDEDKLLYMLLSQKILKVAKAKNKDFDYSQIEKIIKRDFL